MEKSGPRSSSTETAPRMAALAPGHGHDRSHVASAEGRPFIGFLWPSSGNARRMSSRSAAQRAENESTFRRVNEDLERKAQELGFGGQHSPYLCECEDPACTEVVLLARSDYEAVRSNPRGFFIVPGHDATEDRVVEQREGFHVVEKTGEEGRIVEEDDPRSRPVAENNG
jgi:hypothetical protein